MQTLQAPFKTQFHREFMRDDVLPKIPHFSQFGIHQQDTSADEDTGDNSSWRDVLTWGKKSQHADNFAIEWNSPNHLHAAQIVLPLLDSHYSEVLWAGEISIHFNYKSNEFYARYFAHYLPLCPASYGLILNQTQDPFLQGLARLFRSLENISDCRDETRELRSQLRHLIQQPKYQAEIKNALAHYNPAPRPSAEDQSLQPINSATALKQIKERIYCRHQLLESQHYRLTQWREAARTKNQQPQCTEIGLAASKQRRNISAQPSKTEHEFITAPHQTINTNSAEGVFSNEHI